MALPLQGPCHAANQRFIGDFDADCPLMNRCACSLADGRFLPARADGAEGLAMLDLLRAQANAPAAWSTSWAATATCRTCRRRRGTVRYAKSITAGARFVITF
jgi:hypothetical protein